MAWWNRGSRPRSESPPRAVDAYGRIEQTLGKVLSTPAGRKQLTAIGKDLVLLGDGTALLRELLDLVEELRQACAPEQGATHRPKPRAANDPAPA